MVVILSGRYGHSARLLAVTVQELDHVNVRILHQCMVEIAATPLEKVLLMRVASWDTVQVSILTFTKVKNSKKWIYVSNLVGNAVSSKTCIF